VPGTSSIPEPSASGPNGGGELHVDPGAFLPEGSSLEVPPAPQVVDVAVLAAIEEELGAVDDALAAIDAGDLARSPLLVELLGVDEARAAEPGPRS
jgi:hypothetical protein